jgi:putative nucleotidyltransferase with HDIG domain
VLGAVFGTTALTIAALIAAVTIDPPRWDGRTALVVVLLSGMLTAARLVPLHIAAKTKVTVGTAPLFTTALLLPVSQAMLVGTAGAALAALLRRGPWFQTLHTTAECALRVGAGAATFALLTDQRPIDDLAPGRWLIAVVLAALVMQAVNTVALDAVVSAQLRERPLAGAWRRMRPALFQEVALHLIGLFIAVLGGRYPWTMPLLALPAWVVHRSLRNSVALREQTRRALEDLADAVDRRDQHTVDHSRRVATLARATAEALRLPPHQVETIALAARLHDIGKVGIAPTLQMKPGPLTEAEWREMRRHPEVGAQLLAGFPELGQGREIVLAHHEWYDGNGYPRGLARDHIPLGARIVAVADAWEAMNSHRAYRWALPPAQARAELERGRGTQFDPAVVDALDRALAERPDLVARPTTAAAAQPRGHTGEPLPG